MSTSKERAERLKAEGNALFAKNDFAGAYNIYTEAIQQDDKNAILYCNRAACAFGLNRNRHFDTTLRSLQATELNPGYAKAWSRLAQAQMSLNRPDQAVNAWKRALAALPVENLTAAEKKQRESYTAELGAVQAKLVDLEANSREPKEYVRTRASDRLPWNRAVTLIPGLQASRQWNSSAYVITKAYFEWQQAVEQLKLGKDVRTPNGLPGYFGKLGVLTGLSNALLSDERVFHIADADFIERYNKQLMFELTQTRAWGDRGARQIMEQIPGRLRSEGWDSVRPAIAVTVRAWIMRAFMEEKLKNSIEVALEFYTSALDLLQWGKELWKDVAFEDKGAVFRPTFIRGIKCLRLDAFMAAYSKDPGENSKYSLNELLAGAEDLLAELQDIPEQPGPDMEDPAFFLSFFRYPLGQAYAMRGFYYHHTGILKRKKEGICEELMKHYMQSSQAYLKAASYFPIDDEKHAGFLHTAFDVQFDVGGPVNYLLMILDKLNDAIPRMKPIWEYGADAQYGAHAAFATDLKFREKLSRAAEGVSEEERGRMCMRRD
ncbi:hypothetical protein BD310DRAFT_806101 [Dichomitus squalens]|uniref:Uncharacterized protein n=1 Tax=Dichomitus squalens TaxID=114155 RepID=A0A4Q9QC56_9APHY|nr:hypothetical protein BD310DRAFT_806101 [Dichomitus squalens]